METTPREQPTPLTPTPTIAKHNAATRLVAMHATGSLTLDALRELGTVVVGRSLDATDWTLRRRKKRMSDPEAARRERARPVNVTVRVPGGAPLIALLLALDAALEPQTVRIGTEWLKDANGVVRADIVPAEDLPSESLARWLRRRFFVELDPDAEVGAEKFAHGSKYEEEDDGFWRLAHASISEHSLRVEIHPWPKPGVRHGNLLLGAAVLPWEREPTDEDRLHAVALAAVLTERERDVLLLHLAGDNEAQIAATLRASGVSGCSPRNVRRDLASAKEKARAVARSIGTVPRFDEPPGSVSQPRVLRTQPAANDPVQSVAA